MHAVLERVKVQLSKEVGGLDVSQAQQHPGGRAHDWTAQQIVEHLILSYRTTSRLLESRLKKTRRGPRQKLTWLQRALQIMVLSFGRMPSGVPTLDETRPEPGEFGPMNGNELVATLTTELQLMDATLERCRRRFGMEAVAVHPWLGSLRVDQWRRFHAVHGLHHAAQLRSVIQQQVSPDAAPIRVLSPSLRKQAQIPAHRSLT